MTEIFKIGRGYCTHVHALALQHAHPKNRKILQKLYFPFLGRWELWRAREEPLRLVRFALFLSKGPSGARPTPPTWKLLDLSSCFVFPFPSRKTEGIPRTLAATIGRLAGSEAKSSKNSRYV
jgi:hypothetical protein